MKDLAYARIIDHDIVIYFLPFSKLGWHDAAPLLEALEVMRLIPVSLDMTQAERKANLWE
jgi:hypothetical protein